MVYLVLYVVTGLAIGISSHVLERYLADIDEIRYYDSRNRKGPLDGGCLVAYALFGIFGLSEMIRYARRLLQVVARRRKSKHIYIAIQSMGLEKFDPIIITFDDGDSTYAGFNYLDERCAELKWFQSGSQLSGGGWDKYTHLTRITKVERTKLRPCTMW